MQFSCQSERTCAAPPQIVYDLVADAERWPQWLDSVRTAVWEEPGSISTHEGGLRRIVVSGLTMREKILVADAPHHHAYTILSGIPVTDHRADVLITPSPGGSLIVWKASFRSRIPFTGPLIWLMLRASIPTMVTALARGAEAHPV